MKRFDDIDAWAENASPELQMILNEATLGRNLAELNAVGLRADSQTVTVPVVVDGRVMFRVAVFEKGAVAEEQVLSEVALGKTFSDNCLIIPNTSVFLEAFKSRSAKKAEEE